MPLPLTLPACPTLRLTHRSCTTHWQLSLPFMIKSLVLHPPSHLCLPTGSYFLAVLVIQLCSSLMRFFCQRLAPFFVLFFILRVSAAQEHSGTWVQAHDMPIQEYQSSFLTVLEEWLSWAFSFSDTDSLGFINFLGFAIRQWLVNFS
jgi:hypothetical protein